MKRPLIVAILFLLRLSAAAQSNDSLFSRLQAISNNEAYFFNVDGIQIAKQIAPVDFTKKNILKKLRKYRMKESDLTTSDSTLAYQNYYVSKPEEFSAGNVNYTSYYFVENLGKSITVVTFSSINKQDRAFERKFVTLLINNAIPMTLYTPMQSDSIDFAGRKIGLGGTCRWMGVANMQCPYNGQMNWSIHSTLEDAKLAVDGQYSFITAKRGGKIISEELVDVVFEGSSVKAKKAVYDFKGVKSLLAGISGGKTLTIYFVAAPVRNHFVSCVMSFWNNDNIRPGGLPPLPEEVMTLKSANQK